MLIGNVCEPTPPTTAERIASCNADDKILSEEGSCEPCTGETPVRNENVCEGNLGDPTASNGVNYAADAEIQNNYVHAAIGTEAAYQRGYWGQGVTVAIMDTGALTTHTDLDDNLLPGFNFLVGEQGAGDEIFPFNNARHGTHVAGIVGAERNGEGTQGVAPSVSLLPIRICCTGANILGSFRTALANSASILNNSWALNLQVTGTYRGNRYSVTTPYFRTFWDSRTRTQAGAMQTLLQDKDAVLVWAAGNEAWREGGNIDLKRVSGGGSRSVPLQNFLDDFYEIDAGVTSTMSLADYGVTPTTSGYPSGIPAEFPKLTKRWLAVAAVRHTSGVANAANYSIAYFSNGCGESKFWCLTAPGLRIYSTIVDEGTGAQGYAHASGTSSSAPVVSGALALLKSRWQSMPMEVIRAILLTTATDLGDAGVDDIYGWGLVNVGKAITLQGNVTLNPDSQTGVDVRLAAAHIALPSQFPAARLSGVSVAVKVFDNAYYNINLSDIVTAEDAPVHTAGHAAADMLSATPAGGTPPATQAGAFFAATDIDGQLRAAGVNIDLPGIGEWQLRQDFCDSCRESAWGEWGEESTGEGPLFAQGGDAFLLSGQGEGLRPFFSFNGKIGEGKADAAYRQYGLRWRRSLFDGGVGGMRLGIMTEASRIDEPNSFWGADFGALGGVGMRSWQGRLAFSGEVGEQWRGGGMIENMRGEDVSGAGLLSAVSGLNAHGWGVFLEKQGLFESNDKLRLTARRKMRITSGAGLLRYRQASGDFTQAFYSGVAGAPESLKGKQTLETRTTEIDLSAEGRDVFALGYVFFPARGTQVALAAEAEAHGGKAFSAEWRMRF